MYCSTNTALLSSTDLGNIINNEEDKDPDLCLISQHQGNLIYSDRFKTGRSLRVAGEWILEVI